MLYNLSLDCLSYLRKNNKCLYGRKNEGTTVHYYYCVNDEGVIIIVRIDEGANYFQGIYNTTIEYLDNNINDDWNKIQKLSFTKQMRKLRKMNLITLKYNTSQNINKYSISNDNLNEFRKCFKGQYCETDIGCPKVYEEYAIYHNNTIYLIELIGICDGCDKNFVNDDKLFIVISSLLEYYNNNINYCTCETKSFENIYKDYPNFFNKDQLI